MLIDFGAAKQAGARFSKSQLLYTEGFAALDQAVDAGKLGLRTDMYAAGAVMWRMVAGGHRTWEPSHPARCGEVCSSGPGSGLAITFARRRATATETRNRASDRDD